MKKSSLYFLVVLYVLAMALLVSERGSTDYIIKVVEDEIYVIDPKSGDVVYIEPLFTESGLSNAIIEDNL